MFLLLYMNVNIIKAQTYKLNYEPKGEIIKFNFDSLTIFTDTTSLFNLYFDKNTNKSTEFGQRIIDFVSEQIKFTKKDTITINDTIKNRFIDAWYIKNTLINLIKNKRVKIYDKHNNLVKIIKAKKKGSKRENFIKKIYLNKETNEELFYETLYYRIVCKRWL